MKKQSDVKISPAKGRPMLSWVGKRALTHVPAFPAQHVETFGVEGGELADVDWSDWPDRYPRGGLLFHGDNKEVLGHLLANGFRGKVKLIYIDPPFDSGADYVRKVNLRGVKGSAKIEGESYSLGEQIQYTDIWANDNYLQFLYERLALLREILADDGSLILHVDTRRNYLLRILMDEIFGADQFRNEIVWQRTTAHSDTRGRFGEVHDTLLMYSKGGSPAWNEQYVKYSDDYIQAKYSNVEEGSGRRYRLGDLTAPGPRPNLEYDWKGVRPPPGRCWAVNRQRMEEYERTGRLVYSSTGMPQYKRYLDEMRGVPIQDVWIDIPPVNPMAGEKAGYPTQKPEALIERLIKAATNPRDLVLDCFLGSGTTAVVAQKLGRRWIGCDINKGAVQTTGKRLQSAIQSQVLRSSDAQQSFDVGTEAGESPLPAQLSFTVWRVNDYDLQIQHNEAVELACEHIGIDRTRTDSFFDGTLGKRLVKIVPFGHPLTPLDLEEVKRELEARPEEDRDVVMVCLGKELAADVWLEEWNQLRRARGGAPNRIEVIELRSDPKYGKFIEHRPAEARVDIRRENEAIVVEVQDFISPSIVDRLDVDVPLFRAKIPDWRSMVDCILIDAAHDGSVFDVTLSDVPERRDDLVRGRYELAAPKGETTVAVKVIDMLGEEVVVTRTV